MIHIPTINREIQKRVQAYPKLISKAEKQGFSARKIQNLTGRLAQQMCALEIIREAVHLWSDGQTHQIPQDYMPIVVKELYREQAMRARCYARWVQLQRMDQATAAREITAWNQLIEYVKENQSDFSTFTTKK